MSFSIAGILDQVQTYGQLSSNTIGSLADSYNSARTSIQSTQEGGTLLLPVSDPAGDSLAVENSAPLGLSSETPFYKTMPFYIGAGVLVLGLGAYLVFKRR